MEDKIVKINQTNNQPNSQPNSQPNNQSKNQLNNQPNKRQILILTGEIAEVYGGLTKSLIAKAKWFALLKNWRSKILTFNFNANYDILIENLYLDEKITELTEVININMYFRELYNIEENPITSDIIIKNFNEIKKDNYVNEEGMKIIRNYNRYGISHDNLLTSDNKIIKRFYYNRHGELFKINYFDNNRHIKLEEFFNHSGNIYQKKYLQWNTELKKHDLIKVDLINNNNLIKSFSNYDDYRGYFVNLIVEDKPSFAMAEARSMDSVLLNLNNHLVKSIFMVHNPHIRPGTTIIRAGNRFVLENNHLNDIDAYLLLTERQKNDIISRFGYRNNYFVINHSIEPKKIMYKKNKTIVMLTRLHYQKRLEDVIKIMKIVHTKRPALTLDIYGSGGKKEYLSNLIKESNLENTVFLKGHTSEVEKVIQSAMFSLITSRYEGFPLAVQESLANGTPVISYDIKYGPADMIKDGVNGYLIKERDFKSFAKKIIELSDDEEKQKEMSLNAFKMAKIYSPNTFVNKWQNLFETINGNVEGDLIEDIKIDLEYYKISKIGITLILNFNIKGKIRNNETPNVYLKLINHDSYKKNPENYCSYDIKLDNNDFHNNSVFSVTLLNKELKKFNQGNYETYFVFSLGKFYCMNEIKLNSKDIINKKVIKIYRLTKITTYTNSINQISFHIASLHAHLFNKVIKRFSKKKIKRIYKKMRSIIN
ncbi:MAG: glycosyltransferase [Methanobrevibacter sp.]|nr:glycosyltransferase [Candidatus Methanoflexus mossambicus]